MSENPVAVTQALLPCPFCGGAAWTVTSAVSTKKAVMCRDCGATGGLRHAEAEAIEAWNTRAPAAGLEREADGAPGGAFGEDEPDTAFAISKRRHEDRQAALASATEATPPARRADPKRALEMGRKLDAEDGGYPTPPASVSGDVVVVPRALLEPFVRLAGPINGEAGRPTHLEAISGPNGTDELQLSTYVGDGQRIEIMDAADFRALRAAVCGSSPDWDCANECDKVGLCFAACNGRPQRTASHIGEPAMTHPSDMAVLVERALRDVLDHYERNICHHEDTHRGGVLWTICDQCGAKWADDEGGFKPFEYPPEIVRAQEVLHALSADQRTGQEVAIVQGLQDDIAAIDTAPWDWWPEDARVFKGAGVRHRKALDGQGTFVHPEDDEKAQAACRAALQQSQTTPGAGMTFAEEVAVRGRLVDECERAELRGDKRTTAEVRDIRAVLAVKGATTPVPVDASGAFDRPFILAAARTWWAAKMPGTFVHSVTIKGDGRVDVAWSDDVDDGRYTLPVTFLQELAALHAAPAAEPDHIGGVWMPGPDEAPAAGEKRDAD